MSLSNPACYFCHLVSPYSQFPKPILSNFHLLVNSLSAPLLIQPSFCLPVCTDTTTYSNRAICLSLHSSVLLAFICLQRIRLWYCSAWTVPPSPALSGFLSLWPWLHCMAGARQWPGTGWSTCICLSGDQHEGFRECICSDLISAWLQDMASTHTQPQDPGLLSQTS